MWVAYNILIDYKSTDMWNNKPIGASKQNSFLTNAYLIAQW